MHAVRGGDERALRDLFDHTAGAVRLVVTSFVSEPANADDVLAEVYAEAWRRRQQFDPALGSPLAWLSVIARTRSIDRLRRMGRERCVVPDESDWFDRQVSSDEPASRSVERAELSERVRDALARIPVEQRACLRAAFFDGASHSEIAAETGVPLGTVKSRIRAALTRLRSILVDYEDESDPVVEGGATARPPYGERVNDRANDRAKDEFRGEARAGRCAR